MLSLSHVAERLNAWLLSRQLSAQLEDIAKGLSVVNTACEEVRNSASLKGILKLVLALGTVLNRGTYLDCQVKNQSRPFPALFVRHNSSYWPVLTLVV